MDFKYNDTSCNAWTSTTSKQVVSMYEFTCDGLWDGSPRSKKTHRAKSILTVNFYSTLAKNVIILNSSFLSSLCVLPPY